MKRRYVKFLLFSLSFVTLLFARLAFAADSPITMLQTTSDQMISELNAKQATLKTDPKVVYSIVHRILLPHVDMNMMSRSVAGRIAWTAATPAEQKAFTAQFTDTLIHTYASALASYTNQTVKFFPIRGGWQNQSQVEVESEIDQQGAPAVPMSYRLILQSGQWKVVDFSVDNVSIIENYRAQFANDLNQGTLAQLTDKLAQHNATLND